MDHQETFFMQGISATHQVPGLAQRHLDFRDENTSQSRKKINTLRIRKSFSVKIEMKYFSLKTFKLSTV